LAEDLLLPDFCSGAAGLSGRFTEGFFHRRSHPALVAEQFAFDQAFSDCRAIDCDVRSALPRRSVVDRACGKLFPRTALASDDHRRARGSGFFDQAYGPAYR
jgi:hypothetical protein